MDEKDFKASFRSLNESFTLTETEDLEKFPFQQLQSKKTQICSVLDLEKALIFGL